MKIAALQMRSSMSSDENLKTIADGCARAANDDVRYLQLPEMAVMFAEDHQQLKSWVNSSALNRTLDELARLADAHSLYLHVGSMAYPGPNGKCFNRSFLFGPDGKIVSMYDKIHLFDADIAGDAPYRESDNFAPGEHAVLASVDDFQLGLSICYDMRFPALYGALRQAGADFMAVPAAFTVPTGRAHWETLLRARAIETGSYVIAAAQSGHHANGRRTYGHSMIVSPWGEMISACTEGEGLLISALLDRKVIKETRMRVPTLANARDFSLSVNHNAAQ